MEEISPELRATHDLIMLRMKEIEGEIKTLAKQGYITEKHKTSLISALHNVDSMVANCIENQIVLKELEKLKVKK